MGSVSVVFLALAVLLLVNISGMNAGVRVARSPQFGGGFSQAQASAQAGGGGFGRPNLGGRPQFGGRPRFSSFGPRRGVGGTSISISKSVSISRGGVAQSSAGSSAGGFGK